MGKLLRLLKSRSGNPRLAALNTLFPSNAVCDLDATIAASYASGQKWLNLIASPADGAAQSAYDYTIGANTTPTTDDPTFNGTAGSSTAYFSFDAGDYFNMTGATSTTPLLDTMHQKVPYTIIMCMDITFSSASLQTIFCTGNTSNVANNAMSIKLQSTNIFFRQRVQASSIQVQRNGVTPNAAGNKIFVFSYDPTTNDMTSWVNTATGTSTATGFTATALTHAGDVPAIGAIGTTGLDTFINGTKMYSVALLNKSVGNAEVAQIIGFYNRRHNRVYA